ncbi:hypothetical protein [Seonamhaeicola sp.]|uniref:hypothetical protein n=1 Tax=Seonamhaeicola sp. TaxID=1912245 RepID=UPI00261150BC|nr:hypothetical protein [Seonamhaeicola sp.]
MKIKLILSGIFFLMISFVFSQSSLNNYKYIIVPQKFDFLKEKDQYQLNSLAEFLFKKHGFSAMMEGADYPDDLKMNRCLALRSDVLKEPGMFRTKLKVELKDCNDQVVYTSPLGESREKEFQKAYNYAIRGAFKHLGNLNYTYKPSESITSLATTPSTPQQPVVKNEVSKEIQELKAEIESLKKEKVKAKEEVPEVKPEVEPVPEIVPEKKIEQAKPVMKQESSGVLYAQEITNGFQLVDSSPKVVYKIKKTGLDNVFLVEGKSAVLFKKGNDWVMEYYSGDLLKQEVLKIKF